VANLHFNITAISRGAGRSAVAAAAYRSGERIRDERTGRLHNYSSRDDVPHVEILLPKGFDASQVPWVADRAKLWNAAERAEVPRNARVAREYQVNLPHELTAEQRRELARTFSQEVADRYKVVVDLAIHLPRDGGDPRNHHAHLLFSSRQITETGFGAKAGLDMRASAARQLGLPVGIAEMKAVRERWATLTNEALKSAGLNIRVDHRSLKARGIDRPPIHRAFIDIARERRALRQKQVERIRENHKERVEARQNQPLLHEPATESTLEGVQRRARENWVKLKTEVAKSRELEARNERTGDRSVQTTIDDDFAL